MPGRLTAWATQGGVRPGHRDAGEQPVIGSREGEESLGGLRRPSEHNHHGERCCYRAREHRFGRDGGTRRAATRPVMMPAVPDQAGGPVQRLITHESGCHGAAAAPSSTKPRAPPPERPTGRKHHEQRCSARQLPQRPEQPRRDTVLPRGVTPRGGVTIVVFSVEVREMMDWEPGVAWTCGVKGRRCLSSPRRRTQAAFHRRYPSEALASCIDDHNLSGQRAFGFDVLQAAVLGQVTTTSMGTERCCCCKTGEVAGEDEVTASGRPGSENQTFPRTGRPRHLVRGRLKSTGEWASRGCHTRSHHRKEGGRGGRGVDLGRPLITAGDGPHRPSSVHGADPALLEIHPFASNGPAALAVGKAGCSLPQRVRCQARLGCPDLDVSRPTA
jgi:hypothetical protein